MIKSLRSTLAARRETLIQDDEKGFTLIELLVVVIIIGILAAIAIPVYLGVQTNAKDASVQSDLANFKTAVVSMETNTGALPALTAFMANPGAGPYQTMNQSYDSSSPLSDNAIKAGATWGANTQSISYYLGTGDTHFCLKAVSADKSYYVTDSLGVSTTSCVATFDN